MGQLRNLEIYLNVIIMMVNEHWMSVLFKMCARNLQMKKWPKLQQVQMTEDKKIETTSLIEVASRWNMLCFTL